MRRVLQASMTLLICLSGLSFAFAEESPLAGLTVLVALVAWYFIDRQGVFALPTIAANLLGFGAFAAAGAEFLTGNIEGRLLSGGHLIVYLSWVFLLQRKTDRHYWLLCALSILQMAVASVLTNGAWFGAALLVYTFTGIWTLSVFLLDRSIASPETFRATQSAQRRLVVGDVWRGVSRDVDQRLLNARFVGSTLVVTSLSLVISSAFFILIPRVWIGQFSIFGDSPVSDSPLTGFTDRVQLGEMGEILENSDPVMSVELFNHQTGIRLSLNEYDEFLGPEPLFRGACLEVYRNGSWERSSPSITPPQTGPDRALIRQEYVLEPIGSSAVFGMGDVITMESQTRGIRIRQRPFSDEFERDHGDSLRPFRYYVYAAGHAPDTFLARRRAQDFKSGKIEWVDGRTIRVENFFHEYLRQLTRVPVELGRVGGLAAELTAGLEHPAAKADRIQNYFTDPAEFNYSLDASVQDSAIDPVEDFLFNRREGHCEYFASSMAVMLRTLGVPSRLISGFKGGTLNTDDMTFTIQQLHAHTWVEAYIDGQWRTYDPTPGMRDVTVAQLEEGISGLESLKTAIVGIWNRGILFSKNQQQVYVYRPLGNMAMGVFQVAQELVQGNTSTFQSIWQFLRSPDKWFSWQGGAAAFILLTMLSALVWAGRKILQVLNRVWQKNREHDLQRQIVEFYERFRVLLEKQGLHQTDFQTAREFVDGALPVLNAKLSSAGLAAWPDELVDKFYQVRFGAQPLSADEARTMEETLSRLESCLDHTPDAR